MQQFLHAFSLTTCRQKMFHFDDCKARKEMRKDRGRTISTILCGRLRWSYQDDEFREQAGSWEGTVWLRIRIICGSGRSKMHDIPELTLQTDPDDWLNDCQS